MADLPTNKVYSNIKTESVVSWENLLFSDKSTKNNPEAILYNQGIETGRLEGYDIGWKEGVLKGEQTRFESTKQEYEYTHDLLQKIINSFQSKRSEILDEIKPELIRFCMEISEKVIRNQLKNRDILFSLISQTLEEANLEAKQTPISIFLSQRDFNILKENQYYSLPNFIGVEFMVDSSMVEGDFRIETPLSMANFDLTRICSELEHLSLKA